MYEFPWDVYQRLLNVIEWIFNQDWTEVYWGFEEHLKVFVQGFKDINSVVAFNQS